MSDKKTEKQLKRPDAFQVFMFRAAHWFRVQQNTLLLAVVPLLVIVLGAVSWQFYRHWSADKRKHELAEIERVFLNEDKDLSKAKSKLHDEVKRLESEKDAAKAAQNKPLIEAKNKEIDSMKADHSASEGKFRSFFEANQKTAEGWKAGMSLVEMLLEGKKFPEASEILAKILSHSMGVEFYQVQVRLMYISVLEEVKRYDEALAEVEKAIPLTQEDLLPRMLITKGRLQLELGKREEAFKTLDALQEKHASSPEARQALALKAL